MTNIQQLAEQVRIILVNPHQPGNIGGVMRAMKNMQLTQLYLVEPKIYPSDRVTWRAAGAIDMAKDIVVCDTLEQALSGCNYIVGTSARSRRLTIPIDEPKQCAKQIVTEAKKGSTIAVLFGREHSGLTNSELQLCHRHVTIPANPDYSSLNLSAAVQVICYEIYMQFHNFDKSVEVWDQPLADANEINMLLDETQSTLEKIGFYREQSSKKLLPRLQRLINRVRPDTMEVQILRGILSRINSMQQKLDKTNSDKL